MKQQVIPASLCFQPLARTLMSIAIGAISSLAGGLSLAETHPGEEKSSCTTDLTCGRETKVISALNYHRIVPDLGQWQQLSLERGTDLHAVALESKPYRFLDPTTGMAFARIPGACYRIQSTSAEANPSPPPPEGADRVCFKPFDLAIHEVTFEEYDRFAQATDREMPDDNGWGRGNRPVINVNFYDAQAFATWLSRKSGESYRLPTEVEWEHAARAGSLTRYPWGDDLGANRANCRGCGSRWDAEETAPVASFAANGWGLHDMIGNVAEWTCSMRDPNPAHSFENCDSPYESRRRVYRNGAWSDEPDRLDTNFRDWNAGIRKTDFVGFRLVRECDDCGSARAMKVTSQPTSTAAEDGEG